MAQFFKGDTTEQKYLACVEPLSDNYSLEKDEFFEDAYNCFLLGDLLFENELAPLANAIPQEIFRESFSEIFTAFESAGTFEAYLTVFRKIFGEDVEVTFTVPDPGKLQIDIVAEGVVLSDYVAKVIENNDHVLYEIITQDGVDNIAFQTIKGFQSQYELEQMLFEMVPDGIYTEINLTLGGP